MQHYAVSVQNKCVSNHLTTNLIPALGGPRILKVIDLVLAQTYDWSKWQPRPITCHVNCFE